MTQPLPPSPAEEPAEPGTPHRCYLLGDVHGQFDTAHAHLVRAGVLDADGHWAAGDAHLWLIGDLIDRGPKGFETIELMMRLEREAADAGGMANTLLGNHEVMYLAARTFGSTGPMNPFRLAWLRNGGTLRDWERLTPVHDTWLRSRPALALETVETPDDGPQRVLLMHADALFYTHYGDSAAAVNAAISGVLHGTETEAWESLFDQFIERMMFIRGDGERGTGGGQNAAHLLRLMGARLIVHGHTPIQYLLDEHPTAPFVYAGGQVMNIDGGMYLDGPGFLVQLGR